MQILLVENIHLKRFYDDSSLQICLCLRSRHYKQIKPGSCGTNSDCNHTSVYLVCSFDADYIHISKPPLQFQEEKKVKY